ncbi:amino acid transporter [Angomonas deanei]|uniref:Transmembrane amino acid transporter protein/Tryptophan/tyrosine permease family, putative n=1 Tax=Angomonas deanei TaxID=59799 RepID=A0A7G2C786_9TRYP|nr:amino acid transporter [Angomonas deanei]CAD2215449.1 Transmembrane amino acid transporter protein/Tryptophan/tyrosine permease family, putative [Angomonas deanei]|eukprot:EPY26951.1 amino acid transporter [Angomonas deanei]
MTSNAPDFYDARDVELEGLGTDSPSNDDLIKDPNGVVDAEKAHEFDCDSSEAEYVPSNKLSGILNKVVPHGGFISNAYNLAAVTLGSGIITLPSAFQSTGVIVAVIVLVVITLCTVYSVYIMMQAVEKTRRTMDSYEKLSRGLLGVGWDYLAAFNMWMFCFGSCVSYVISTGDLLSRATDGDNVNTFVKSKWGNRVLVIVIWAVTMLPLSIPKEINSLRYFSVIGVSCMMYFVVVIIVHSAMNGFEDGKQKHELALFKTGNDVIVGFSMFIFAYLCQTNVMEVYREMKLPSPKRITIQTGASMTVCLILYILAGVFGYLEFGSEITDSILLFYNVRNEPMVAVAYIGIGIKMIVGFAICMQPSRDSVYYCLGWWFPMFRDIRTVPLWVNALICGFMAIVALVLGLFIPSVTVVFGLVGSFCGGFLGFIYPALFVMYAGDWSLKTVGWFHYICTYLLLICGVVAVVFGTIASIYGEIK